MAYFEETELAPGSRALLLDQFGFVPNLFRAQARLPRLLEGEAPLVRAIFGDGGLLARTLRHQIVLAVAAAYRDPYWVSLQYRLLAALEVAESELQRVVAGRHAGCLPPPASALLDFALKLSCRPDLVGRTDVEALQRHGWSDPQILEAAVAAALARALSILAAGTGALPDFDPPPLPPRPPDFPARPPALTEEAPGPYLALPSVETPSVAYLRDRFGFVPDVMGAQASREDLLAPQIELIKTVLLPDDVLSRLQKEALFIAVAAANLSTYCVANHCHMLRAFGVRLEDSDQIAADHHLARLSEPDKALLDFALKLRRRPGEFGRADIEALRGLGFGELQVLEAVAMTGMTTFFNTLSIALGATPDFQPLRVFRPQEVHRFPSAARLTDETGPRPDDPDAELVSRVQAGDVDAFEELVKRHSRRVFRTLAGVLGNADEAEDATQEVFLKAYRSIGAFAGRSRFATWLVAIAANAGIQRLRERRPLESLDEPAAGEDGFRPREVRAWQDDPEQSYAKQEMRRLVEGVVLRLPAPYRVAVMLRDIEQLPNEEAAAALNLTVPGFKARVFRGRCILREALAPHFAERGKGAGR